MRAPLGPKEGAPSPSVTLAPTCVHIARPNRHPRDRGSEHGQRNGCVGVCKLRISPSAGRVVPGSKPARPPTYTPQEQRIKNPHNSGFQYSGTRSPDSASGLLSSIIQLPTPLFYLSLLRGKSFRGHGNTSWASPAITPSHHFITKDFTVEIILQ